MNPHNQLGVCCNWRFFSVKANSKRRLLERQVETLEKHNPAPPLGVTQRALLEHQQGKTRAGDLQSKPALRWREEAASVNCPKR